MSATSSTSSALEALRFRQDRRIFGDQTVAAEDEVGRRFAHAARE